MPTAPTIATWCRYPSIWGVLQGGSVKTIGGFVSLAVMGARLLAGGYYTAITQQWITTAWGYWNWLANNGYPPVWTGLPTYTNTSRMMIVSEVGQMIEATQIDQYYSFFKVVLAPKMQHPAALDTGSSVLA